MTFIEFKDMVYNIQRSASPFDIVNIIKTPVTVMYNGNEYNFHLSIDQPEMVKFINADDETKDIYSLITECHEITERLRKLYADESDFDPKFDIDNYNMDHHYCADIISTFDGNKITSKIVFYISDSEKL